jgi:hypothetical protein
MLLQAQQLAGAGGCQQLPPPALPPPPPVPRWTCGLTVGGNFTCGSSELLHAPLMCCCADGTHVTQSMCWFA